MDRTSTSYLYVPNKTGMFLGESLGMAVTFVDRWDEGMGDGGSRVPSA